MKSGRDEANNSTGRDLVVLKTAIVNAELEKLGLNLRRVRSARRMVSTIAYEAGSTAGASLAINPESGKRCGPHPSGKIVDFVLLPQTDPNGRVSTASFISAGCRPP